LVGKTTRTGGGLDVATDRGWREKWSIQLGQANRKGVSSAEERVFPGEEEDEAPTGDAECKAVEEQGKNLCARGRGEGTSKGRGGQSLPKRGQKIHLW